MWKRKSGLGHLQAGELYQEHGATAQSHRSTTQGNEHGENKLWVTNSNPMLEILAGTTPGPTKPDSAPAVPKPYPIKRKPQHISMNAAQIANDNGCAAEAGPMHFSDPECKVTSPKRRQPHPNSARGNAPSCADLFEMARKDVVARSLSPRTSQPTASVVAPAPELAPSPRVSWLSEGPSSSPSGKLHTAGESNGRARTSGTWRSARAPSQRSGSPPLTSKAASLFERETGGQNGTSSTKRQEPLLSSSRGALTVNLGLPARPVEERPEEAYERVKTTDDLPINTQPSARPRRPTLSAPTSPVGSRRTGDDGTEKVKETASAAMREPGALTSASVLQQTSANLLKSIDPSSLREDAKKRLLDYRASLQLQLQQSQSSIIPVPPQPLQAVRKRTSFTLRSFKPQGTTMSEQIKESRVTMRRQWKLRKAEEREDKVARQQRLWAELDSCLIIKQGWGWTRKVSFGFTTWKKKYLILQQDQGLYLLKLPNEMEGIKKWYAQDMEVQEIPLEDKERPHSFSVSFTEKSCSYDLCFTTAQDAQDWMGALFKVLAQKGGNKNHSEECRISPPCRSNITGGVSPTSVKFPEEDEEKMFREQERMLRNQQRENKLLTRINPDCTPMSSRKSGVPQQVIASLADLLRERAADVSTIRRTKQEREESLEREIWQELVSLKEDCLRSWCLLKKCKPGFSRWNRRFVVLTSSALFISSDPNSPKGTRKWELTGLIVTDLAAMERERSHSFHLVPRGQAGHDIAFQSAEELNAWRTALAKRIYGY